MPLLDPQCRQFLAAVAAQNAPGWHQMSPTEAREIFASLTTMFGTGPSDVVTEDRQVEGRIPIRVYKPHAAEKKTLPVVVYFHGGGWVLGNIETHDALCRRLCHEAGCAVVSVDYRLSPEHPFPLPLDDCFDATIYVSTNASDLGIDPAKLVVAGDSAGGALATAVAIKARDTGGPTILAQMLIYPAIDAACNTASYQAFATDHGLTKETMRYFWDCYLGGKDPGAYAIPTKTQSLESLPQAIIITAGYDVLRDEGEQYARDLMFAGVKVSLRQYEGMIHGFVHFAGVFDVGKRATSELALQLRQLLQ